MDDDKEPNKEDVSTLDSFKPELDADLLAELSEWQRDLQNNNNNNNAGTYKVKSLHLVPWLEKYRPQVLTDIAHQTEVVQLLQKTLTSGSFPNLLFHGPSGTGKTTIILALAKQLYGASWKHNVLELNASSERGIDIIRAKVKAFAKFSVGKGTTATFKLVILDEADSMTKEAQGALRRMMETESAVTRFCILCNYVTQIIDPIKSRTVHFRFQPLPADAIQPRLEHIQKLENIKIEPSATKLIATLADGDMRKAITLLHSTFIQIVAKEPTDTKDVKDVKDDKVIMCKDVENVAGRVPVSFIREILDNLKNAQGKFSIIRSVVKEVIWGAFAVLPLLQMLTDYISCEMNVSDICRAKICQEIGSVEERLLLGGNEELQLTSMFATLAELLATC